MIYWGCMGQWVGSGQMTNLIKLELIDIIRFCLKIYDLWRHPYLWVDGWVNGWAHVKSLKSNKSWPNWDNSIMDILEILLDILLKPPQPLMGLFLGGLSLHLNHLIALGMTIYDWRFGTLPFRLVGSNLDTRDLETYPRTYSGHFWNMSIFDNSRAIWVLFRKWVVSENQSFLNEGAIVTPLIGLVLGGEVPRLNYGPICFPIQNT